MSVAADSGANRAASLGGIHVDLPPDELKLLDLWIEHDGAGMTRPEALRHILKLVAVSIPPRPEPPVDLPHLDHEPPAKPVGGDGGNY